MKSKTLTLISLSILSLVVLMGLVVATTSSVIDITDRSIPTSVSENAGSFTFTFNLTYTGTFESADISFAGSTTSIGSITIPTATSMNGTANESRIITGTINNFANQGGNTLNAVINATFGISTDDENTFSVTITDVSNTPSEVTDCQSTGNPGNDLRVKNIDINNNGMNDNEKFGDDDAWFPLDDIEVEIEVENNGDDDFEDIEIEWGLWDTSADEWVIELDDEKDFNLKDGKDETIKITFNLENSLDVDLEDLTDGDNYRFYVIANGKNEDTSNDICEYDFEDIELVIEENFVVLHDFQFPETISCDSEMQILVDLWNIGDEDQEDVSVRVHNSELGISEFIEVGDIDAFDKEEFSVTVKIPEEADEKFYSIKLDVYDEDNDIYENDFDDDEAKFNVVFQVSGSCGKTADALVSASLESGGIAGEELVVKATIVNSGDDSATYKLNVANYAQWAVSGNPEINTLLLNKGESRDVLIRFDVKEDALGEESFNLEVLSNGELVLTQPVSVSIEEAQKGFPGIKSGLNGNTYLWIIGALNVILVIIIIIVAIRVARR